MRDAIREHGLPLIRRMLTAGSPLIDQGFVSPDGLSCQARGGRRVPGT
jgi:hypothetical protein